jgi:hypothetical protein
MRSLDSGIGKDVVERSLIGGNVGKETSVKV